MNSYEQGQPTRDFKALEEQQLYEIDEERKNKESSPLFKLCQLGDAGLRAAMRTLKGE